MPTISVFYGIIIQMYWNEHAPPHFHAIYGDAKATIDINRLVISEGSLPPRIAQLVLRWARLHQAELIEDWELCLAKERPKDIEPLN
ncbi:MAG TPA: transcriptional regulator [Geobacter sp.]|nr:transcriptional regulator [Geobacter sp.]